MNPDAIVDTLIKRLVPFLEESQGQGIQLSNTAPLSVIIAGTQILAAFKNDPQAAITFQALVTHPNLPEAWTALQDLLEQDAGLRAQLESQFAAIGSPGAAQTLVKFEPEADSAYPRRMPSRRRCEG